MECECGTWTGERCAWSGPKSATVLVEYMPQQYRSSHEAAGNVGTWPANGAERVRVSRECAETLLEQPDERDWSRVVGE